MRKLLNTLYVTSPDTYLSLDGENVIVKKEEQTLLRVPLHNLEGIVAFGYTGASPALMGACAQRQIDLCFMTQHGRFLARVVGLEQGNVLLRHKQHMVSDLKGQSCRIARNIIAGKLYNSRWVIERTLRDHALRVDAAKLKRVSLALKETSIKCAECDNLDTLRGWEGEAAAGYFSVFNELILQQQEDFVFDGRSRRPPLDRVNAMLSFTYTLLTNETAAALSAVGLDPYVGFLHRSRPGRVSLALDIMEELRSVLADRFVLSLINRREISASDFTKHANGTFILKDEARKKFLNAWQQRKQEIITHPFLDEKIPWGLAPHAQALLLSRYLRGDLDDYPPFLWK
jgi:CRISPR-associated protein Cas1